MIAPGLICVEQRDEVTKVKAAMGLHVLYITSSDYAVRTGGHVYNSRLVQSLSQQGIVLETHCLEQGFPVVPEPQRASLARRIASLAPDTLLLMDHVYLGRLLELLRQMPHPVATIFLHSDVMEHGTGADEKGRRLFEAERACLQRADALLVPSHETARYAEEAYAIPADRIRISVPGNDPVPRTDLGKVGERNGPRILSVGAIIPRKRYDYLLDVAAQMGTRDWVWQVAGDPARYPGHLLALKDKAEALGLTERFHFLGDVSDAQLEQLWQQSNLYVAASHYEGYGMAVAEALRHGVPVASTASGAVSTWAKSGVMQVSADDAVSVAAQIERLFATPDALQELGDLAWDFGRTLPSWAETFAGTGNWLAQINRLRHWARQGNNP